MAVTSITLTDPVSGYSVAIMPNIPGVSAQSLEVEPAPRTVFESRVGSHGTFDTTRYLDGAIVTLQLLLFDPDGSGGPQAAFLDSLGPLLDPGKRPNLIVTDSEWAQARQLTVRTDSMLKQRSDPTNWPVQIFWQAPNGTWEASSQTVLNVPVTLPSSTGIIVRGGTTAPSGLAAAAVGSGGTFAAGSYFWKVTAVQPSGESAGSNEATATLVLNGSANLTWSALPNGTTAVKVYRGTASNAENVLVATLGVVTSYTDTGTAGTAATVPGGVAAGLHVSATAGVDMPPTSSPGEFQATNPGTVASQWTALLYGPATGPKIANDTAGLTLEFTDSIVLQPGEFIALDSRARTALRNGNANASVLSALNFSSSDWWTLLPGVNGLRYYPTSGSAGAEAVVSYLPAWMT